MFKLLFGFFLIVHSLGDFYFQSDGLSQKKREKYGYVILHSAVYLLVSLVCLIPFWSVPLLISAVALAVLHFAADSGKFWGTRKKEASAAIYIADQLVHLGCMTVAASILSYAGCKLALLPAINQFLASVAGNPNAILTWTGLLLMAIKPANVTIKQMVAKYKPAEEDPDNSTKAGAFIGTLERIIILLLLSVGQYSAIGLILTAKSVARYNKIAEDKKFAEYYLLGTLLSTLYAITIYFVFA